ncbi:phosphosulfolactate synthase [Flavobacteriaceae bacterium]|jgi:phosphosulfolactate synthase|nr:phosphosulfolactate synthase [Flavobacteriaceae bacterium]MDB9912387.1 phosphosulfolactate synthase [Flavobacteriaceae bacterium]|tara:strand:- start:611 stop:1360 length:750 start_codon:yes stop_codon:yes gene_type:complete
MNTYLDLPERTKKNRSYGINSIHDVKLTTGELRNVLEDHSEYMDVAKLGVGTALVVPKLKEKIALYQEHNVEVYFGGTLFEKFYYQNRLDDYKRLLNDFNVNLLEVSCGTIDLSIEERIRVIEDFKKDFNVLSEVGSKDSEAVMAPSTWLSEIQQLLDVGCQYVITEGRNSGTAGIYRGSGEIRTGLVADIIKNIDSKKIIFEAPTAASQMFFINAVGVNVNLGNVNPLDLLLLEAQRVGLRSETFYIK